MSNWARIAAIITDYRDNCAIVDAAFEAKGAQPFNRLMPSAEERRAITLFQAATQAKVGLTRAMYAAVANVLMAEDEQAFHVDRAKVLANIDGAYYQALQGADFISLIESGEVESKKELAAYHMIGGIVRNDSPIRPHH